MSPDTPIIDPQETGAPGVRSPPPLLWIAAIIAGFGAITPLALAVIGRGPFAIDRAIMLALRTAADPGVPAGPGWLRPAMIDVTALGDGTVLTLVVIAVVGLFLVQRLWLSAGLLALSTTLGSILAAQAKLWVDRPRPDIVPHLVPVHGLSFPSGHATNSAIIYLSLAVIVTQVEYVRAVKTYTLAVAILLVGVIGISRVYLGVHWPSDVLAGWCAGTLWALLWWWIGAWTRASLARRR